MCVCVCVSHSVVSDSLRPHDCNPPGSSVLGFSRQEYGSGLPFPPPGLREWGLVEKRSIIVYVFVCMSVCAHARMSVCWLQLKIEETNEIILLFIGKECSFLWGVIFFIIDFYWSVVDL